ncbi:MAG: hypothetical protein ACFCGT_22535, partial [Sandaracinaceae bacterium]
MRETERGVGRKPNREGGNRTWWEEGVVGGKRTRGREETESGGVNREKQRKRERSEKRKKN